MSFNNTSLWKTIFFNKKKINHEDAGKTKKMHIPTWKKNLNFFPQFPRRVNIERHENHPKIYNY